MFLKSTSIAALLQTCLFSSTAAQNTEAAPAPNATMNSEILATYENDKEDRSFGKILFMVVHMLPDDFQVVQAGASDKIKPNVIKMLRNYGCHCFPNPADPVVGGQGVPVDDMDRTCWTLARCHACVHMDYFGEGMDGDCDPGTTGYLVDYNTDPNTGEKSLDCSRNNRACMRSTCECDKRFAETIAFQWSVDTYNTYYWKNGWNMGNLKNPTFDRAERCLPNFQNTMADSCCGEYPTRRPFFAALQQCCPDGNVKGVGRMCADTL